ncbi:uncharacterized protein LOC123552970 [Mercenaria mercenaria]|uniref:uncharacterized protein LOC123552970 n=1 Tax=Mercenaria mercenaria TaxID=6596 RepID=UPI00234EEE96|nr:uncharacterized protein LOC123552970 [Mercenaria mercenaria]
MQVSNIKDILGTCKDNCILAFTDGSAIGNPGPTGAGAAVYLNGYDSIPVLLKRSVSKRGNNFSGEIVGIEIALEFLTEVTSPTAKKIHIFTDCQAAITSVFCKEVPTKMIENIITIKKYLANLQDRKYEIEIRWIPGHKELTGNELADSQAKAAASEMCTSDTEENTEKRDAREVVKIMKEKIKEKWNNKYSLSENVENIQEVYQQAGVRSLVGEENRETFCMINQLLSGHTRLNAHWSKIDSTKSAMCCQCKVPETAQHYIFSCARFTKQRETLERDIETILYRENISCGNISMATLVGELADIRVEARRELIEVFSQYIQNSGRFSSESE